MGQRYYLTEDQDDLLSEAEKAFDLSARKQATGWAPVPAEEAFDTGPHGRFNFLSGWLRRPQDGDKPDA